MKRYFVTAAGTGIGKTYVTACLVRQLRGEGKSVVALKPIISGFDPQQAQQSDTALLLEACGIAVSADTIQSISPWRLRAPLSPDMAAEDEKRRIDFAELLEFCRKPRDADYVLIEGAGGVMSPVGDTHTALDLMTALGDETLLVSGTYLGAISHTLTAYEVLQTRNIAVCCIILSESETQPVLPERTLLTLKRFLPTQLPVHLLKRSELSIPLPLILS